MKPTKLPSWISGLLGTDPVAAPPHVFAVDRRGVRYARFGGDDFASELMEYHERPLPEDVFSDGPLGGKVRDAGALGDALGEVAELASASIDEASLVIPDDWLRVVFAELDELPAARGDQNDVVLWKLKRLVPFRVEDLRVTHLSVERLPSQEEEHRLLVGFGVEALLGHLESAFQGHGIRIGRITNGSLALLGALPMAAEDQIRAFAVVNDDGYTILFSRREAPLLYRYKGFSAGVTEQRVMRDLRLSRMFLAEQLGEAPLEGVGLLAPSDRADEWRSWLEEAFGRAVVDLSPYELGMTDPPGNVDWLKVAPMVGAVRQEVA